ncbi:MAG TPA: STAS domain-containing protein [Terriglobia bacterium]|nr:STAS domain-containing protein [Terriglobia bacterium]
MVYSLSTVRLISQTRDGIAIVSLSGKLMFDESLMALRENVRDLLRAGVKGFVFDFTDVPHCDSSGCGELIGAYSSITKAGGRVAFVNPTARVRALWERIRLIDIFTIFGTMAEAEAFVRRT